MTLDSSLGSTLLFGGIWAGANLMVLSERVRSWRQMPVERYVGDFRRSTNLMSPFLSTTGAIAVLSAISSYVLGDGTGRLLVAFGAILMIMAGVSSCVSIVALDRPALRVTEGQALLGAEGHRASWRRLQAGRTLVAGIGFACLCSAASATLSDWAMVFFGGLWAGGVCLLAVERDRAWQDMSPALYLVDFKVSIRFVDPLMPICCLASTMALLVVNTYEAGAPYGWVALCCIMVGVAGPGVVSAPTVFKFLRCEDGQHSIDIVRGRAILRACNTVRTSTAVMAFAYLVITVIFHRDT